MIQKSHDDLLYFDLLQDGFTVILIKIQTNHNMEFALEMLGRMSPMSCHIYHAIGEAGDFMFSFYLLDISITRLAVLIQIKMKILKSKTESTILDICMFLDGKMLETPGMCSSGFSFVC